MLSATAATHIHLAVGVTDMRKSFNGLYAIVVGKFSMDPTSGHLFVFCNRRRDRLKILLWDGSGLWVCAKRLEKGTFAWPGTDHTENTIEYSHAELNLLLGGLDLRTTRKRKWINR